MTRDAADALRGLGSGALLRIGRHGARQRYGAILELEGFPVPIADQQQDGRADLRQQVAGEVGPAGEGGDSADAPGPAGGGDQGGRRAGAGAEKAERQPRHDGRSADPVDDAAQALGQQRDVEAQPVVPSIALSFARRQEIDRQSREAALVQHVGDIIVAGAGPVAADGWREDDEPRPASGMDKRPSSSQPSERAIRMRSKGRCDIE